ncbi:MAG TPA: glycosyltransferase family 9 protein [Candidatus Kapabacteria bacterium]|nr:glycosyltransferase family 9 protein [Candidatus Kapabacteria bacterium]
MNALIIETAFLGDAIVSLSLARAIKEASSRGAGVLACVPSRVTYLVRPDVADVVRASPDVDTVITFDKRGSESGSAGIRKKVEELNALEFDTLFLLHSSRRSQTLASLLHCEIKIGFEAMNHVRLTKAVPDAGWRNRYERAILLLSAIRPDADLTGLPRIVPPAAPELEPFFQRFPKTVTLAPGSAWKTKKWGDGKFLHLSLELTKRGFGVVVIGGSEEMNISSEIKAKSPPGSILDLAGKVPFLSSMSAIARSSLLVANDSAPTHAAVAVGTKVLTVFGPTIPAFGFAPPEGSGEVIELPDLWCRPCAPHGSHTCPIYTHECMERISVESVFNRVLQNWETS